MFIKATNLDGKKVEIIANASSQSGVEAWGEGLRQTAGSLAHDPSLDAIMEQIQRDRQLAGYREVIE